MNISPAHWHLMLNHFPIVLSIVGTGFIIASFLFKKQHLKFGGLLILIAAALVTYPAFQTGEGAEDGLEGVAGVSKSAIETHEEIASTGLTIILITGAIALIAILLLNAKKKAASAFILITLLGSIASAGLMSYIAYTGGEIRHTEIRGDFGGKNSANQMNDQQNTGVEENDDDD